MYYSFWHFNQSNQYRVYKQKMNETLLSNDHIWDTPLLKILVGIFLPRSFMSLKLADFDMK